MSAGLIALCLLHEGKKIQVSRDPKFSSVVHLTVSNGEEETLEIELQPLEVVALAAAFSELSKSQEKIHQPAPEN